MKVRQAELDHAAAESTVKLKTLEAQFDQEYRAQFQKLESQIDQVWRLRDEGNTRSSELIEDMEQLFQNTKKLKRQLDENTEQLEKALEL